MVLGEISKKLFATKALKNNGKDKLLSHRLEYYGTLPKKAVFNDIQLKARESVLSKIINGTYPFESKECICGYNLSFPISRVDRYYLPVQTVICSKCGLVRLNPRMTLEAYKGFYDKEFYPLHSGKESPDTESQRARYAEGKKIFNYLNENINLKDGFRIFEVGCGGGGILQYFHKRGFTVAGADLSSNCIAAGQKDGVPNLFVGGSEKLFQLPKADIVILNHVIEHFLDIRGELNKIKKILKKEGYLFIATPGIRELHIGYCDIIKYLQNAHVYYFSLPILKYTLSLRGFKILTGTEKIISIFQLIEKNQDLEPPGNEYEKNMQYLEDREKHHKQILKFPLCKRCFRVTILAYLYHITVFLGIKETVKKIYIFCRKFV